MDIGNLLHFQSALQRHGEVDAAPEKMESRRAVEVPCQLLAFVLFEQHRFKLPRQDGEVSEQPLGVGRGQGAAHFSQVDGKKVERGQLGCKSFCRGDGDFRPGVRVNHSIRLARHHTAQHVADGQSL